MPGEPTTHYNLPTYAADDSPNLTGAYNSAMQLIDTQMFDNSEHAVDALADAAAAQTKANANETAIGELQQAVSALQAGVLVTSDTDADFNTAMLATAKVNKDGIVYFKAAAGA